MRGSLKIATVAGIGIYIHWTFWLIIVWTLYMYRAQPVVVMALGVGLILAVFACVVLHELGHALMARRFGVKTRDITLLPIGGVARLERMPEKPIEEFLVAVAGPAVNVVIAILLFVGLLATGALSIDPQTLEDPGRGFFHKLLWINIVLVLFNMIPAFPMDGGRVLRALLGTVMTYAKATRIAARVGQLCAVGFAILGLLVNPFLLLIAAFVFYGAHAEAEMATTRVSLDGLFARDAMMTDFRTLRPDDRVSDAVGVLLDASQTEFPVFEDGHPRGMLTRNDIVRAVAAGKSDEPVSAVMHAGCPTVDENQPVDSLVTKMRSDGIPAVVVIRSGGPAGLLTLDNVFELVMIQNARERTPGRAG